MLFSLMNTPIRIVNSSKTCIDHIFVHSKNIDNFKSINFEYGINDHYLLGLKYEKTNFFKIIQFVKQMSKCLINTK